MKLKNLTPEQREHLKKKRDEMVSNFLTYQEIDKKKTIEVITFVYYLIKLPCPRIIIADDPYHAQRIANKLMNTKHKKYAFGSFLTNWYASWYAWYETYVDFGIITKEKFPKYFKLREYMNCGFDFTIEFDKAIIITKKQKFVHKNERGMHCLTGPAIMWPDGYGQYYINGRCMPKWLFEKFELGQLTREDFINEQNEDVRAGMYELIESKGEGSMLQFLGAELIDEQSFVHANGEIEEMKLYRTKEKFAGEEDLNGNDPAPLAWLQMCCPSTTQKYLIPTDGSFNNCIDAAKFHRPNQVPQNLEYSWNSRN